MQKENPTIVFPEPKRAVIESRSIPSTAPGTVLIKSRRTLISTGTELTILSGDFPPGSAWSNYGRFPFVPGYDNVGEVIEVGEGVSRELIGKRVASYGPHALFVTASIESIRAIEVSISDDEATFFTIAEIVMNGIRRGDVRFGESVVIYGAGLLGQLAARVCRLSGARPVFVVDIAQSRLERLPNDPQIIAINPNEMDVNSIVKERTRGRMVDVVFEVTGNPNLIPLELSCLREQGRFVVLSSPRGPTLFDFHDLCNFPSFNIIGAHNRSHPAIATPHNPWTKGRHDELFFDLVASGELDVKGLISHRIHYKDAPIIYQELLKDRSQAMGVIIIWS